VTSAAQDCAAARAGIVTLVAEGIDPYKFSPILVYLVGWELDGDTARLASWTGKVHSAAYLYASDASPASQASAGTPDAARRVLCEARIATCACEPAASAAF